MMAVQKPVFMAYYAVEAGGKTALALYDGSDKVTNNVVVCGGMWLANSTFLQNASFNNEDVLLSVANNLTGNDAIVISGKSVKTDTMTLTESTVWTLMIIFVVVIPVVTLVICLVVFIKRRHL